MKSSKTLSVLVLVLLSLLLTTFTFAYWSEGVKVPTENDLSKSGTVTIGEGSVVETTLAVTDQMNEQNFTLVPIGKKVLDTEREEIEFSFNVKWESKDLAKGSKGFLDVTNTLDNIIKGTEKVESDLFEHKFEYISKTGDAYISTDGKSIPIEVDSNDGITIKIKVQMKDPKDRTEYELVKNSRLESTYTFGIKLTK